MKFNLSDDAKSFVYGVLGDVEIAASVKANKKFRKFATKLKGKFQTNTSYIDLKYGDFRQIKNTVQDAVTMLENSKANQEHLEGETEEEQKAIQTKLEQINELYEKAKITYSELEEVEDQFGENLKKIAKENMNRIEKANGVY